MFLCCGDALFDLFAGKPDADTGSASAVKLVGNVGGSPMNVAAGLARLGHNSRYFTKLSSDLFGQRMRHYLADNNIDTGLSIDSSLNTTLAIVETNQDGSANYVFYTDNTADVSITSDELPTALPDELQVLHFGSYSTAAEPTASSLLALATREGQQRVVSYDPNLRPTIEPDIDKWREMFAGFAASSSLIKASDEDIETLLGKNQEQRFVEDCFNYGAKLVFITRGPDGASGFDLRGNTAHSKGLKVNVVDTVGAGDTFQAATLHWLATQGHLVSNNGKTALNGDVDLAGSMAFAIRAAAITCTRAGADLPTLADLD